MTDEPMISDEFPCEECGDVFLSPKAALLCADRDLAEEREARHAMTTRRPST